MSNLLEQASLVMIPSGYKEDVVYSEIPLDGAGDMTFTRASNGTRVNSAGLVEVAPWNLVEYSEDFSQATPIWNKYQATITSNTTTAPNGTLTADSINDNSANDVHIAYQDKAGIVAGTYTISIYAKANTLSHINLQWYDGTSVFYTSNVFNLSNGTTTGANQSIENVGNGWYRCIFTFTTTVSGTQYPYVMTNNGTSNAYVGTGQSVFIWGYQLNIGSTAKPYFPTTDRLNVPRLTYQNGGGGCPSLLLEKQSTNLVTYSEQFDNAAWTKLDLGSGSTTPVVTANYATSPDGTQNADRLQCTLGSSGYSLIQQPTTASGTHTGSIWVKSNTGANQNIYFRISTNTTAYVVTPEWQRITITEINGDYLTIGLRDQTGYTNYSCDILIWGAQLEASSYATSYIPTTSTSATRVADVAYKSSISSLFGASATSFFMDFEVTQGSSGGNWTVTGYDGSNLFSLCQFDTANNYPRIVFDGGVDTTLGTALSIGRHKIAVSFATNDFRAYIDGALVLTDTSCTYNRYDRIAVNGTAWTGNTNNTNSFKLNQYAQFPTVLTNAELASLTTL